MTSTPSTPTSSRRVLRARGDRKIAGVCGGLARYFGIDPAIVRIAAVVLGAMGPGLVAYAAAWILMPYDEPAVAGGTPAVAS